MTDQLPLDDIAKPAASSTESDRLTSDDAIKPNVPSTKTDQLSLDDTTNPVDNGPDASASDYIEENIRTLDWKTHIRLRPGMYIGKLGDGENHDDGIYVLLKEVIDNSIDEYAMGFGKQINVEITETTVTVRDFGRGVPLGKLVDVASKINTGGKYDSKGYKSRWASMALVSRLSML